MALDKDDLNNLKKQLEELNRLRKAIGEDPLTLNLNTAGLDDVKLVREYLKDAREVAEEMNVSFIGISQSLANVVSEIGKSNTALNKGKSAFNSIKSIAEKFRDDQLDIARLNEKDIVSLQEKLKNQQANLVEVKKELDLKIKDGKTLSKAEIALVEELKEESVILNDLNKKVNKRLKEEKKINEIMGLTGGILKGMEKILSKLGFSSAIFEKALKKARKAAKKTENSFDSMKAGLSELGKGVVKQLKDPLFLAGLAVAGIVKSFNFIKDLVFNFSKETAEISRNFGISNIQAGQLNTQLKQAATNTSMLNEETRMAYVELNKSAGTFAKISSDNLKTYNQLVDAFGFSKEAAQSLYKTSVLQGRSLKDTVKDEFVRVTKLREQQGLAVNVMDVMDDMSKASATTKLSLQGQGVALGQAAYQAKILGLDLGKMDAIAGSLLDFESSIAAEMEAELLTGRQLNLEKARLYALNNNLAGVGKELEKQGITAEKFSGMNRIQQEAIAKAMGMNRDSMGDMLMQQELIKRGKAEEMGSAEDIFEKNLENYDLQQKFNRSVTKLKEIFTNGIAPVIEKINSFLNNKNIDAIVKGGLALGVVGGAALTAILYKMMFRGTVANPTAVFDVTGGLGKGGMTPGSQLGMMSGTNKVSKIGKTGFLGRTGNLVKGAGRIALPLALAGAGMNLVSNLSDNQQSTGGALVKTLDQNKMMAAGALIGLIGGPPGAAIGAGIGGILDMLKIVPEIGELIKGEDDENKKAQQESNNKMDKTNELLAELVKVNPEIALYMGGNKVGQGVAEENYEMN